MREAFRTATVAVDPTIWLAFLTAHGTQATQEHESTPAMSSFPHPGHEGEGDSGVPSARIFTVTPSCGWSPSLLMLIKRSAGVLLPLLGLLVLLSGIARAEPELTGSLQQRLQVLRHQPKAAVVGVQLASVRLLEDFYRARGYRPAWICRDQVADLLRLAEESRDDGLRPGDFNVAEIRALVGTQDPSTLLEQERGDADILLSDTLLRLVHHSKYGKVNFEAIDPKWYKAEGPYSTDLVADLQRVLAAPDLAAAVRGLKPEQPFYTRLKAGLARYRAIADAGGWPSIPEGGSLKPGMRDPRVAKMRERLKVTGDFTGPAPTDPQRFDPALKNAVIAFQGRHFLRADGTVGAETLKAMNVSAKERVDQIRVNLERMRWVYDRLPGDYLLVDVAGQRVHLFRGGEEVWTTRAIVGRAERPTPTFRDQVEYLEINPTWTVPPTILKEDILPKARGNPEAVRKKGLMVLDRSGRRIAPEAVNWHQSAASFPYILRQEPGEKNALGHIKFMFPNRFSVYLHDTPTRHLFERPQRLYSSGCVRVDRPLELAERVLNEPARWDQERLKGVIDAKRTRWVHLKEPLAIILAYWTADAEENGAVRFRQDVYERDAQLLAALEGAGPLRLVYVEPPTDDRVEQAVEGAAEPQGQQDARTSANGLSEDQRALDL